MPASFTLLHDKGIPPVPISTPPTNSYNDNETTAAYLSDNISSSPAVALCPSMDLVAYAGADSIHTLRWLAWQKVFSVQDAEQALPASMKWSPDGSTVAVADAEGGVSLLAVGQAARHLVVPSPSTTTTTTSSSFGTSNAIEASQSSPDKNSSLSTPLHTGLTPLYWIAVTERIHTSPPPTSREEEDEADEDEDKDAGESVDEAASFRRSYRHRALCPSPWVASSFGGDTSAYVSRGENIDDDEEEEEKGGDGRKRTSFFSGHHINNNGVAAVPIYRTLYAPEILPPIFDEGFASPSLPPSSSTTITTTSNTKSTSDSSNHKALSQSLLLPPPTAFLSWDGDTVANNLKPEGAPAGGSGGSSSNSAGDVQARYGAASSLPAVGVGYGCVAAPSSSSSSLTSSSSYETSNASYNDVAPGSGRGASGGGHSGEEGVGYLTRAAAGVARLCETLVAGGGGRSGGRGGTSMGGHSSSGGGSSGASSGGNQNALGGAAGGVKGGSVEPAAVLSSTTSVSMLPILACAQYAKPPMRGNFEALYHPDAPLLTLLAHGTFPILRVSTFPLAGVSLACDCSSLLTFFADVTKTGQNEEGETTQKQQQQLEARVRLRLYDTTALRHATPVLQHALNALCVGDACIKHLCRSVTFMAAAWNGAYQSIVGAFKKLEENIAKLSTNPDVLANQRLAAAAYYPDSPVPLAVSELYRLSVVGATSGSAISEWLEVGVDEAALIKLARTIESALAAMETLAVTRAVRSCELLLMCIGDLQRALVDGRSTVQLSSNSSNETRRRRRRRSNSSSSSLLSDFAPPGTASEYEALGFTLPTLNALGEETTHILVLLQVLRTASSHARAVYSAIHVHLRLLQAAAAAAALETTEEDSAAKRDARRKAAITLAVQDSTLVREAFQPNKTPDMSRAGLVMEASGWPLPSSLRAALRKQQQEKGGVGGDDDDEGGGGQLLGSGMSSSSPGFDPLGLGLVFGAPSPAPIKATKESEEDATKKTSRSSSSNAHDKKEKEKENVKQHDAFLPYSLGSLLGDISLISAIPTTTTSLYFSTEKTNSDDRSLLLHHERSITAQIQAVFEKWQNVCAAPSEALSLSASRRYTDIFTAVVAQVHGSSSVFSPQQVKQLHQITKAVSKSSCIAFDDRSPPPSSSSSQEEDGIIDTSPQHAAGYHIALIPIPAETVKRTSNGEITTSAIVLLRISLEGTENDDDNSQQSQQHQSPHVSAAIVTLPPGVNVLASSYYGPMPGAVAASRAMATEAGLGYLPIPSLGSDDSRCFVLVVDGPAEEEAAVDDDDEEEEEAEKDDEEEEEEVKKGASVAKVAANTGTLLQLEYRDIEYKFVPASVLAHGLDSSSTTSSSSSLSLLSLSTWALLHAPKTTLSACSSRRRPVPEITRGGGAAATAAASPTTSNVAVDACGPRGAAIVTINGRRALVFDMAEDEDEEEEEEGAEDE